MMMRYEEYKRFPDVWVDEIPKHWELHKMKYLFQERTEKGYPDEPLLVASQNMGVVPKNVYGSRTVEAQKDLHLLKLVQIGDFVISLRSFQGGLEYAYYRGIISPAYTILTPHAPITAGYFRYLAKSKLFIGLLTLCVTGIREGQNIDYEKVRNHLIPVPPRAEQDRIVRYLDWQVSKINRLIAAKKKEIATLSEYRQTVIDHAVTHGIDNVSLKESGVNWITHIPEHWNMVYAKKLFYERKDKAFATDIQLTASQKHGVISQNEFMRLEGRRVTVVLTGADILNHVGKGDFIISMRSFQGGLEYSFVEGKISSAYVMIIPFRDKVYDGYFRWLLKSTPYIKALQGTSDLVRDGQALRFANFVKVYLPEVPIEEQKRIADYVETEVENVDKLTPKYMMQIARLQELRTRLISDVVTGQVDVRGIEVPDGEYINAETLEEESEDETEEE